MAESGTYIQKLFGLRRSPSNSSNKYHNNVPSWQKLLKQKQEAMVSPQVTVENVRRHSFGRDSSKDSFGRDNNNSSHGMSRLGAYSSKMNKRGNHTVNMSVTDINQSIGSVGMRNIDSQQDIKGTINTSYNKL